MQACSICNAPILADGWYCHIGKAAPPRRHCAGAVATPHRREAIRRKPEMDGSNNLLIWTDGSISFGRVGTIAAECALSGVDMTPAQQALELADLLGMYERSKYPAVADAYKRVLRMVDGRYLDTRTRETWVWNIVEGKRRVNRGRAWAVAEWVTP